MKKWSGIILIVLLVLTMVFGLTACGNHFEGIPSPGESINGFPGGETDVNPVPGGETGDEPDPQGEDFDEAVAAYKTRDYFYISFSVTINGTTVDDMEWYDTPYELIYKSSDIASDTATIIYVDKGTDKSFKVDKVNQRMITDEVTVVNLIPPVSGAGTEGSIIIGSKSYVTKDFIIEDNVVVRFVKDRNKLMSILFTNNAGIVQRTYTNISIASSLPISSDLNGVGTYEKCYWTSKIMDSDSMYPTMLLGETYYFEAVDISTLQVGSIVLANTVIGEQATTVARVIVNIDNNAGVLTFTLQGENNVLPDTNLYSADDIIGKYICAAGVGTVDDTIVVTSVSISDNSVSLSEGDSTVLTATVYPNNASNKTIRWESSDSDIVSVSNGTLMAHNAGTATITVYTQNGKIATCSVTVSPPTIPYTSLTLIPNVTRYDGGLYLMVGDSYSFSCNVMPLNGNETLTLKTDNPSIVSIVNRGNVLITGSGTANVYWESESGLQSNTCPIQCFNISSPEAPLTLNNWSDPAYLLTETVTFSTLDFSFSGQYGSMNNIKLNYNLVGTKTYCIYEGAYAFKVNFTVKNSLGVVIGSGTITTTAFSTGETVQCSSYKSITLGTPLVGGDYSIELIGVRW